MELKQINLKDRVINLFSDVCEESCKEIIEKIIDLNIKDNDYIENALGLFSSMGFKLNPEYIDLPPITLNLSTFGGDVLSGWGLCDCIRTSDTYVKGVCYGKVMSMGIPILLSCKYKAAHKNTTFMLHDISGYGYGKLKDLEESVNELKRLQIQYIDFVCSRTKFPRKKMEEIIEKKQDFFFTAEEALKWKFIDEIIDFNDNPVVEEETKQEEQTKQKTTNKKKKTKQKKSKDKDKKS